MARLYSAQNSVSASKPHRTWKIRFSLMTYEAFMSVSLVWVLELGRWHWGDAIGRVEEGPFESFRQFDNNVGRRFQSTFLFLMSCLGCLVHPGLPTKWENVRKTHSWPNSKTAIPLNRFETGEEFSRASEFDFQPFFGASCSTVTW